MHHPTKVKKGFNKQTGRYTEGQAATAEVQNQQTTMCQFYRQNTPLRIGRKNTAGTRLTRNNSDKDWSLNRRRGGANETQVQRIRAQQLITKEGIQDRKLQTRATENTT